MQASWKEVLPVDPYTVTLTGIIQPYDLKVINYLYQPLIGPLACQLYATLWHEAEDAAANGDGAFTHHHLMVRTNSSLDVILEERKKLEGIGLLRVYKKTENERPSFIYALEPPLSPARFFSDGLLNIYLYNRVGLREYRRLKQLFTIHEPAGEDVREITADFNDVFTSLHSSELSSERLNEVPRGGKVVDKREGEPKLRAAFDFDRLFRRLSDVIISKEAFTEDVKAAIEKLAFVYHIDAEEMSRIIQSAFLHTGVIDIQQLRKEVRDYYQLEHGDELPALAFRTQPHQYRELSESEPKDDFERQILFFETISPYELLEELAGGGKPAASDLRIVEEIMFDQKLPPGVVNVLLHYVMTTNDYKLVKNYVQKIAAHWARKKIKTVRAAMELAKEEHKKYQEWHLEKQRGEKRTNPRRDRLPKWMTHSGEFAPERSEEDAAEREKRLEKFLNQL
ncbi:replication initiation and membrane attachment family protein [Caenibacillus caldisaponilyticus]|uniref:replication initiation and membrane attachment family protein n=1 Tax=Caenibacillus caldisaponilyticus TaxID=1674942 RepID=UPI001301896E|nr:DnaD domain protein [Caenibacillus caldisaponilyticus]